ncbi:hypothetical protein [Micromonospora trifolii]|uniref:hypothetical protein n=1 Tax=Micromonospora trifolii TaxID=2911208 RepID=UPI003CE9C8E1
MKPNEFRFGWQLPGIGCAVCTIGDGRRKMVRLVASYLTDALADVLHGLQALYRDNGVDRFFFDQEPTEIRWVVRRASTDAILSIYQFNDVAVSLDLPDSAGQVLWRSTQPRSAVVHAVTREARRVLNEYGEQGYRAKWVRHPFPVNALLDLERRHRETDRCADAAHPALSD